MKAIQIDDITHIMIKIKASERGLSMKDYIDEVIRLDHTTIKESEAMYKKLKKENKWVII